jgi:NAD(P)-dependent dehydrogenase (short-subunit alcohol dehydrogenase family)
VDSIFQTVKREFDRLDFFIGNAGIWPEEEVPLQRMDYERWRGTLGANLDAIFLTTKAALTLMPPGGRVVLVGSTAGQRGEAMHADYAATKGAMISLVKSLCIECAPGITVNCVAPGWVDTEMSEPCLRRRRPGADCPDHSAAAHRFGRGHRRPHPVSLLGSGAARDRRDPECEWRERALWVRKIEDFRLQIEKQI